MTSRMGKLADHRASFRCGPDRTRPHRAELARLQRADVLRLGTLRALGHLELDLLVFFQ